jgi:hypothetical protein
MNDRIKELGLQAADWLENQDSINPIHAMQLYQEKFAESIVLECIRYFNEEYTRDFDTLWREDLTKGIKHHFGVKE